MAKRPQRKRKPRPRLNLAETFRGITWKVILQAAVIVASFAANATSEGATVITHPNVDLFPNGTVTCLDAMGSYISANPTIVAEFRAAIDQAIEFFKAIPVIAILPIGLVLWGATLTMKFALVAFAVFWPLVVQVCYGVRSLDPVVRDTTTMLQVRGPRKFLTVILPSAAPFIATGLRVAVAVALIVDVIAELIGGTGIGERILLAENAGPSDYPQMYAYIVVAGILGVLLSQVVKSLWTQWVTGPARAELAVSLEHLLVGYVIAALVGIGVVFQDYGRSLYPWLTVARNVDLPLRVRGVPRPSARSGWPRCWRRSGWPTRAGATRGSCPAACSSGWRSPARSPTGPTCCSWTSRSRRWTRRPALSLRT